MMMMMMTMMICIITQNECSFVATEMMKRCWMRSKNEMVFIAFLTERTACSQCETPSGCSPRRFWERNRCRVRSLCTSPVCYSPSHSEGEEMSPPPPHTHTHTHKRRLFICNSCTHSHPITAGQLGCFGEIWVKCQGSVMSLRRQRSEQEAFGMLIPIRRALNASLRFWCHTARKYPCRVTAGDWRGELWEAVLFTVSLLTRSGGGEGVLWSFQSCNNLRLVANIEAPGSGRVSSPLSTPWWDTCHLSGVVLLYTALLNESTGSALSHTHRGREHNTFHNLLAEYHRPGIHSLAIFEKKFPQLV